MKKSFLFTACCIGLILMASCKKDPVTPTINILEGSGCVTENAQVYSGEEILVGFTGTGENLTQIEIVISQNGIVLDNHSSNLNGQKTDPVAPFSYTHAFTIEATGTVNIKGTVTDANGLTASKSFNINYNEKPNAKFVGFYKGEALVTGSYDIELTNMDPIHQDLDNQPYSTILDIVAGDDMNEVIATVSINEQTNTVRGIVDGDRVVFEAINDTYTMNYDYSGFNIPITLNMTYNITGTLNGDQLDLEGDCNGNSDINLFIYNGTLVLSGVVGGSLDKIE